MTQPCLANETYPDGSRFISVVTARKSTITFNGLTLPLDMTRAPVSESVTPGRHALSVRTILSDDEQRIDTVIYYGGRARP